MASLKDDMTISCQEVFGPVVGLYPYQDVEQAIRAVDEDERPRAKSVSTIHTQASVRHGAEYDTEDRNWS
ncbi:MAG: aldehyde dehydrogenase family protein [Anaerolineales bacterium]